MRMDYSNYPVAKRTRSHLIARHLEGIRKKAKRAGEGAGAGGGAGDLELKLNGGTRANGLSGVGAGDERILKLRKGGRGESDNGVGVTKEIKKFSEKGRKLGKRSKRGDDESEDEEVKFVCELVPESNGSRLKIKGDDFDGESMVNSRNLDVLKVVEELSSLSKGKKGREKGARYSNVGKERVGVLKRKVEVRDNHSIDLDDSEEFGSSSSEEDKGERRGRKGSNVGRNKVGDLTVKAKVSDYQSVDSVESDDSVEFDSSSGEEDKGMTGVESSIVGKKKVGDLKEKAKVSDNQNVDSDDSEEFDSSSGEEDKRRRGRKKGGKGSNVAKKKGGDLKEKVKASDNQYVDSDDSEEFDSSSSEEVKNRNAGKRYVGPLKRKLEASEDDKGKRNGRKGVRTSNLGKIKVGPLKGKVEAGDNLFADTDDSEELELGSSEEDKGKKGGKRVKNISVEKKNVRPLKRKMKASENQSFDSVDLDESESSSSEEDNEESYDSSTCDTDSSDDYSDYTEEEDFHEEIKEENDDDDEEKEEEEEENVCRTGKENGVGGKGNKNTTKSGVERVNFKGKGKGKAAEARLREKFKHCSQREEYSCWDDKSKDGNGRTIRNKGNNGKQGQEEKGKTDAARVSGLEKRRFCGLDILVDSNKENVEEPQGVASRLRSRSVSKCGKEKLNEGKASHPLHPDKDSDSSSGTDGDNDENGGSAVRNDGGKRKGKLGKPIGRKNLRAGIFFDPLKILTDSLWNVEESLLENFSASEEKAPAKEKLVYKFSLADQDPKPPEKSEWEKEVDNLFTEMHMCLTAEEIGSSSLVNNDDTVCPAETDSATLCSRGFHQLRLDEEIGIICRHCFYVHLEIKHILPSFSKHLCGRPGKYLFGKAEGLYSDFQFEDTGAENLYGFEGSIHNKGTVWDLIPGIKSSMYEHQREGFEFIWKNIAGGICIENLEKPLSSCGSGCIISHAPGTGKTRLSIVFLQSFMKLYPKSRPIIIAPRSMLLTWEEEFKKWNIDVPFHNINNLELSGQENEAAACFLKKVGYNVKSRKATRIIKLLSWKNGTSVLGISYRLFEKLAGGGEMKRKAQCDPQEEQMGKALLQLCSLLVLDEGHTPRNEQSLIWKALSKVETKRRIILSGTPFQNNFIELYNTLCLVNPKFGDTFFSEYNGELKKDNREISKASRGKWASMTNSIGDSCHKLRELKAMIDPFVHVHKGTILQENLPGLRDALILLRPTDLQKSLLSLLKCNDDAKGYLEFSHLVTLVSVHPSLLPGSWVKNAEFSAYRAKLKKHKMDPHAGVKTKFVIELARLCVAWDEKVLIFSQYLDPLTIILKQLETKFNWNEGREVLYMDGKLDEKQRQSSISSFNDPNSKVRVLLASTKACSEGINLVGASRVVLLDVVWNPSVERQAISRAYRLGQRKIVYIYHLIAGMMEVERYERQIAKERLSELVFSSKDMDSCNEKMSSAVSEDEILEAMVQHNDKLGNMFQNIIYQPKESDLVGTCDLVDKF